MYLTENMDIWARDNRHQGFAGAYLSACTHAQAILGIDPRQTTVEYKEEFGELQKGAIYDEAGYKLIREIAYDVFHGNTLDDEALNALADLADEAESYTVVTPDNYEAAQATLAKMEKDNYAKTLLSNKIAAYEAGRELGEYSENIPVSYDVYWNMMAKQDDILTLITDDDAKYWHYDANGNPVAWEKTKVLFIGNSFTYQNGNPGNLSGGVPRIFNDIAEDLGYYVETYMIAGPNWYLYKHADAADECGKQVDELLHHFNDFDYVVIQEQSVTPAVDYDTFLDGVKSLQGKINDTQDHAKIYLYATWGSPLGLTNIINDNGFTDFHDVEEMELGIRNAYYAAGEACQLPVTPVGKAYIRAFHEGIDPWAVFDHRHPGHTGAYLSACVHVANMLGGDPRRTTFECDETIEPTPVRLDADTYKALRQIAYEIVKEGVEVDDDAHLTTRVMMHLLDGENIVSTTGVCATIGDTEASVKVDVPEGYSLPDPLAAMLKRLDGSETAEGFAITYTEAEGRNPATLNFTLAEDEITEEITFEVALTK
ncbi:MAG: hypothetical protein IJ214_09890 [Clostridia bacterium]|nr:hypothetical protein [Clostridia bacterium]